MAALTFRRATLDDAPQLRALTEHAFSTPDSRPDWTGDAVLAAHFTLTLDAMKASLTASDVVTFAVLDAAGEIIASASVGKKAETGRISMLVVHDAHQRGGLGGRVLAYAEEHCRREWAARRISLNALSSRTALRAWYARRGYRETGETSPFPRESGRFAALAIPDDLCFVEMIKDVEPMQGDKKTEEEE
ncbi:Acyl-CoA N-acyltransferase [Cordyceps fumosorosea ARSEF 2679]|uniref:Acyl-CoA N-acyltransferase n=1 Tax=Cordyceps fumosorosea (strain ARSEF 2679) TaxID=1081104 RepID=A0A167N6R7_CORFA|nr:Acyl-CoA N-acyltransferase [Cordyceps fumosorosea ARSEF 2679]OAA55197.1 Acyl-CoA N-acyltransferase [Cordyceps fumosorosea ARSEF 2679]